LKICMSQPIRKPVRVAHVALQLETGGMERLLVEFARRADRTEFEPIVVCLGRRGPIGDEIEARGARVIALNLPPGVRPSALFRLARLFRDERIDVVHTHNTKPLLYAGPAARMAGVRAVVHTRHGQRHGATRRQTLLFRLAARCADRIVCVSADSERLCRAEGIGTALVTVPNGIDCERFAQCGPRDGGPAVFVGRLTPEKDIATLIEAMVIAIRREPRFRLTVAGAGPCAAELAALAKVRGLEGHVRFVGDTSDVPALLATASLFVLPSRTEGMPLTVIEAMACGLPVVATRVGGTPEVVVDGETGLLVAAGDAPALATAMLAIHGHPRRATAMGEAGRRRAVDLFDVRSMVGRYEAIYREVLGGRRAAAA
jgi:glycosyltransferase involved in cell wall biosynthesis